ncbi:hypothetical protein KM043_008174 [Ampulex compressa]|nr:hypothetical protein KM043_008174 [Ampulex compressa]
MGKERCRWDGTGHKTAVSRPLPASTLLLDRSTPRVNFNQGCSRKLREKFPGLDEEEAAKVRLRNDLWGWALENFPEASRKERSVPDFVQPLLLPTAVRTRPVSRDPYYTSRLNFIRETSHRSREHEH